MAISENAEEMVSALLTVLRKKDKLSPECCAAAISALDATVFRRFCRDSIKFQTYENIFLESFQKLDGYHVAYESDC